MIKSIGIICPKCNRNNAYNTDKESFEQVDVNWLQCGFCFQRSDKEDWKQK